ncbi:MAG: hypothetical protein AB8C46_19075 [Burkholderiaceae bacterium]
MHPVRGLVRDSLSALLILFVLLTAGHVGAQQREMTRSPELIVGVSLNKAHVQQKIIQRIRLESPFRFDGLRVELGTPTGADVLTLQAPNVRPFENWDVSGFVYETSRALFVHDAGPFTVPTITARGLTTNAAGIQSPFETTWPGSTIAISPPEHAMLNDPWLVADDVTLSESWSRHPDLLKVGEVATRTITVQAKGARAEQIDAPVMSLGTGVQVLPGQTTRSNEVTDNDVTGTLKQQFEVRIASEQLSDIAPIQVAWWDATSQRPSTSAVRGWRIEPILPVQSSLVQSLVEEAYTRQQQSRAILFLGVLPALLFLLVLKLILRRFPSIGNNLKRVGQKIADQLLGPSTDLPDMGFSRLQKPPREDQS